LQLRKRFCKTQNKAKAKAKAKTNKTYGSPYKDMLILIKVSSMPA